MEDATARDLTALASRIHDEAFRDLVTTMTLVGILLLVTAGLATVIVLGISRPLGELTRTCVIFAPLANYKGTGDVSVQIRAEPGNVTLKKSTRFLGPNPNSVTPAPR